MCAAKIVKRPNLLEFVGLVPCKLSSKRLPRKNLEKIDGRTLLEIAIEYLLDCGKIHRVYVTSDDPRDSQLRQICAKYETAVQLIPDPKFSFTYREVYLVDIFKKFYDIHCLALPDFRYLVTTTPDNPIKPPNLAKILSKLTTEHEYLTFDKAGNKVGALHIMNAQALHYGLITGYAKYSKINGIDIHTADDLKKAQERGGHYVRATH